MNRAGALPGIIQNLMAGRLSQIAVQKKYALVLLCKCQRKIHGNGGFSLVFDDAGYHQYAAVCRHLLFHAATQLANGFHKQKTAGRIGN